MKKLLFPVFLLLLLSCNSKPGKDIKNKGEGPAEIVNVDEPVTPQEAKKKVTDRDYSITAENAYNDIFLDSLSMENYIAQHGLGDKKIGLRIRSFYNARNYQYAWFTSGGLSEQARFFWNQYDYAVTHLKDSTLANSVFFKQADRLMNQEEVLFSKKDTALLNAEFAFTENFIRYINSTYGKGYVKRKEQEKFIPIKKLDPVAMADSVLSKKHKDDKYYDEVNDMYAALKKNLELYSSLAKAGNWAAITAPKGEIKKGDSLPVIQEIKKRLQLMQDMSGNDSSLVFTDSLEAAVKKCQARFGYKPTGTISASLISDINVQPKERLKMILLNMDRMRWMPQKPEGYLIIVNLPEFILHVLDGTKKVFDMVVVVGKVGHNTMMFNGDLNQVIMSPYWNVPPSIIKNEIEPAMQRNPNYLASHNMEKVGNGIRQRPGPGNSLGKVKFIFPNSFNMYFHDTPAKSLFGQDKRAFSHGCVRLSEPQKMAEWVLKDDPAWNTEKIVKAMNQDHETSVMLKKPIPVFIIYYTAWVNDEGQLNFRDDVYGHDKEVLGKMFTE